MCQLNLLISLQVAFFLPLHLLVRMFASMNTIIPGLYLGDMEAAEDLDMLRENNISRILIAGCNLYKHYPQVLNTNENNSYLLHLLHHSLN